jgi:glycosyltransferase involved in cell wall biosynthesis
MRIGIDGLPLTEMLTGIGHYTNELARHLASQATEDRVEVISPRAYISSLDSDGKLPKNLEFIRSRTSPWNRRWWSIGLPRRLRRRSVDVFHGTNFEVPLQNVCPGVITIHDLSMLLHASTQERKLVRRAQLRVPLMARAANMVITPTESVRQEVHEHLQIPLERIVAVPEAARDCFRPAAETEAREIRERLGINQEFLLYVGTIEPRKNLDTLREAFEEVRRVRREPLQLVLAGRKGWLVDELLKSLERSPEGRQIVLTGYLSDRELSGLYSSCKAFVYPSLYEGFGLPPLEAMACGAPVVVSRISSLIEVTGKAARSFPANKPGELTAVLLELLASDQVRQELSRAGLERASHFSWAKTARETRSVYTEAINRFGNANC